MYWEIFGNFNMRDLLLKEREPADISLYSSPSMPNISLGRPASHSSPGPSSTESKLPTVCEAEVRAAFTARFGVSLTGRMLTNTLPYYPALSRKWLSVHQLEKIKKLWKTAMESEPTSDDTLETKDELSSSHSMHVRTHKPGHRPLGRTQSAPLPLGHPMLTGAPSDTRHHLLKQVSSLGSRVPFAVLALLLFIRSKSEQLYWRGLVGI